MICLALVNSISSLAVCGIYLYKSPLLQETRKKLGSCSSHEVKFFSFSQDRDSVLNSPDGRRRLEEVGIGSPRDVGAWLVRVFREDFGQESLANRLESFTASLHTD